MRGGITEHNSQIGVEIVDMQGRRQVLREVLELSVDRTLDNVFGRARILVRWHRNIRWSGLANLRISIFLEPDDRSIHSEPLLTGFIASVRETHEPSGPKVEIIAYDRTMDLVHCNPIVTPPRNLELEEGADGSSLFNPDLLTPASWGTATLGEIVRDYCKPFGIKVVDESNRTGVDISGETTTSIFEGHTTDEKEKVWNTIKRLCTTVGVTPYTDQWGRLVLGVISSTYRTETTFANAGTIQTNTVYTDENGAYKSGDPVITRDPTLELRTGNPVPSEQGQSLTENDVLKMTHEADFTKRYSDYKTIIGVTDAGDREDPDALFDSQYAYDGRVGRWRPVVVQPEVEYTTQLGDTRQYAKWLMRKQRGDSNTITVDLRYWFKTRSGNAGRYADTYQVGDLINLNMPNWRKKGQMVIAGVSYNITGASHRKLTLTLKAVDTYSPVPVSNVFYRWMDRPANAKDLDYLPGTESSRRAEASPKTNIYKDTFAEVDLTKPLPDKWGGGIDKVTSVTEQWPLTPEVRINSKSDEAFLEGQLGPDFVPID